ncbi:acyl-CoA thioesterase [Mycolicibacterium moriokaense]|nr:acyl-CoA thioesterase [Mycolicibacterium moriokaense]
MKPSPRLLKILATASLPRDVVAARPSAADPVAETITKWRVLPTDIDLFGHMNNSRYLLLMDYARVDYLARLGLLRTAVKNRWTIPVGSAQLEFRRSLRPFEWFEIGTQVLSWNERCFYMRQTFRSATDPGRPTATGYLTVVFRSPKGRVSPAAVVRLAVDEDVVPPLLDNATRAKFGLSALPTSLTPAC